VRLDGDETAEALFLRLVPVERRLPVRLAVGDAWAAASTALRDGDDVVVLPPVGGG
jgi:molybdopterin converting factor small subunit